MIMGRRGEKKEIRDLRCAMCMDQLPTKKELIRLCIHVPSFLLSCHTIPDTHSTREESFALDHSLHGLYSTTSQLQGKAAWFGAPLK